MMEILNLSENKIPAQYFIIEWSRKYVIFEFMKTTSLKPVHINLKEYLHKILILKLILIMLTTVIITRSSGKN
jgi:hypothetical protein